MPFRYLSMGLLLAALLIAGCDTVTDTASLSAGEASSLGAAPATDAIPGQYIVVFQDHVADAPGLAQRLAQQHGADVLFIYEHALKGFAFSGSAQAAAALERNPIVAYVEADQVVTTVSGGTQSNATWGLDRTDQRALPLDGLYSYVTTASNVHAYILDSGIRYNHDDFDGRAVFGFDSFGSDGSDGNGHGTHVAGTVGGRTWGIAKGVTLYAVRVLNNSGSGSVSGVVAGVDWVAGNHKKPAVANMSLGGGASTALDDAVRRSISAGVTYVLAAGNDGANACNYSPARVREGLTVGATNSSDTRASWSNFGDCVDLFAPGVSITSAWHTGPNTRTNTISGTSMAAPHVAGVAALYLANNPGASPAQVFAAVQDNTTKNIVGASQTANAHLLYSLFDGSSGGDPGDPTDPTDPTDPEDPGDPATINLDLRGYKSGGRMTVDLTWSGASSARVDIWRQAGTGGSWGVLTTVANNTSGENKYTDSTSFVGGGTLSYQVCHSGSSRNDPGHCSPVRSWTF
jgi:subtilisin family serine protease